MSTSIRRFLYSVRIGALCLGATFQTVSASLAADQDPDGAEEPPAATMTDEEAEDASTAPSDAFLPEAPETTVIGRPAPLPASPLAEGTVTTPTRTAASIGQVGSATSVITAEQIRSSGHSVVADVLRGATGTDVVRQGAHGGLTSVFLRGGNSNHTKVLLDGIPINDPSSAGRAFDFSNMGVDNIERIEIVRGPQSTLHGSDAMGGVINIITKRGEGPMSVNTSFMGGSYGTTRDAVSVSGGTECYDYSLGGAYFYTDGFSAASAGPEDDHHRMGTASGRLGWRPRETFDVDFFFRWADVRSNVDDAAFAIGTPPTDDPLRLNLAESFFSRIQTSWESLDGALEQTVAFSYTNYDREDTDDFFPSAFQGQTRKVDWQADLLLTHGNLMTVGVDYLDEAASSFTPAGFPTTAKASQNRFGIFAQDQIQIGERWFSTVGFRWEDHNVAGPAQTYQFRSTYHLYETGTSFHGTLGTGFRAPSLAENLFPFGNANLEPEESRGWDVGATQRWLDDDVIIEFYYYRNDFTNLIQFDLATFTLENIGNARTHGVELVGLVQLTPVTAINASYTRTDSWNADTGVQLVRRPRDKGSLGVLRQFCDGRGSVNLYALFFGESNDSNDGAVVVDGYTLLNMVADYQLTERMRCFCRFDNLLNEHYEVVTGYGTPLFSAFGGIDLVW